VTFSTSGAYPNTMKVYMATATAGATIFYTVSTTDPAPIPTHNGATPTGTTKVYTGPVNVIAGAHKFFAAIAYKSGMVDSVVTYFDADNTNNGGGQAPLSLNASTLNTQALTPTITTIFSVWDGDWAILEEYSFDGTTSSLAQQYVQGYHGLLKTTLPTAVYYYQDELGSTSHIADVSGALLEHYKYDLYGKPTYWDNTNTQIPSSNHQVKDLGNGGSRWIAELGLYDDRNRLMSPELGRFLQPDPIGFKGDASNLYRYCGNDWANRTDPLGLDPITVDSAVDRMAVVEAIRNLLVSEGNSDRRGVGLERATTIGTRDGVHGPAKVSNQRNIGKVVTPDGRQRTEQPDPPKDTKTAAFDHNHTNDARTTLDGTRTPKGSILSPHDRKDLGDSSGKPVYVAARDSKTAQIIVERYRPSAIKQNRDQHSGKDSATESLSAKDVDAAQKSVEHPDNSGSLRHDLQWNTQGK
jgi:RHS repeat-associated protein